MHVYGQKWNEIKNTDLYTKKVWVTQRNVKYLIA